MSDDAIDNVLKKYAREHLSPTPDERDYVTDKYQQLREFLGHSCFKSGSFARFTAIHPMHDLDVIWITYNPAIMDNPEALLKDLADDLATKYRNADGPTPKIIVNTHSVTLEFDDIEGGFAIDVVPATPSIDPELKNDYDDPIFIVPEVLKLSHQSRQAFYAKRRSADEVAWIYTDPKGYIKQAKELDDASGGNYRKVAKFLKTWRHGRKEELGEDFKLKAFHAEQVCAEQFTENPKLSVYDALRGCFNVFADYIIDAPRIEDRAYTLLEEEKYIDAYLDDEHAEKADKEVILSEVAKAAKLIAGLTECKDEAAVVAVIEQLLAADQSATSNLIATPVTVASPPRQWASN